MQCTSRTFLIKWLNDIGIKIDKIEEIGKGAVLCSLLKKIDSDFPPFKKEPWNENDYNYNLKLVQLYFNKKSLKLYFPIEKMVKLKMQDNLEVIQQVYKLIHTQIDDINYDNEKFKKLSNDKAEEELCTFLNDNPKNEDIGNLKQMLEISRNENTKYIKKLQEIEKIIKETDNGYYIEIRDKILKIVKGK